jgi:hypothetical protein
MQTGPEFKRDIPSNVGIITVLVTERQNRPAGLRKPYEYILPCAIAERKYKAIRDFLKEHGEEKFQCSYASKKGLSRGMKFNLFLLGYSPALCGPDKRCTREEWEQAVVKTQEMVHDMLGPDARMYIDSFDPNKKFQARFETYIAYEEMI